MRILTYTIHIADERCAIPVPDRFADSIPTAQAYAIGRVAKDLGISCVDKSQLDKFRRYEVRKTLSEGSNACHYSLTPSADEQQHLAAFLAGFSKPSILFASQELPEPKPQKPTRKARDYQLTRSFASCAPLFCFDELPTSAMNVVHTVLSNYFGLPPNQSYRPTLIAEQEMPKQLGVRTLVYACNGSNFTFIYDAKSGKIKYRPESPDAANPAADGRNESGNADSAVLATAKNTASGNKLFAPEFFDKTLGANQPGIDRIARAVSNAPAGLESLMQNPDLTQNIAQTAQNNAQKNENTKNTSEEKP